MPVLGIPISATVSPTESDTAPAAAASTSSQNATPSSIAAIIAMPLSLIPIDASVNNRSGGSRNNIPFASAPLTLVPTGEFSHEASLPRAPSVISSAVAAIVPIAFAIQIKEAAPEKRVEGLPSAAAPVAAVATSAKENPLPSTSADPSPGEVMNAGTYPVPIAPPVPKAQKVENTPTDSKQTVGSSVQPEVNGSRTQPAAPKQDSAAPQDSENNAAQKTPRTHQSTPADHSIKQEAAITPAGASAVALNAAVTPNRVNAEMNKSADVYPPAATDNHSLPAQDQQISDTTVFRPQPAKEISMRVSSGDSQPVDIKVVDRAGSVRVAVRTPDEDLARNLQSGLGDLVHRLEHKGFEAETWSPTDNLGAAAARSFQGNNEGSSSQGNARDPWDGSQQGNGGQQQNGRNRPKWVEELEQKLGSGTRE